MEPFYNSVVHETVSLCQRHFTVYPMGTGDSFPSSKAVGAWSWPLTSI